MGVLVGLVAFVLIVMMIAYKKPKEDDEIYEIIESADCGNEEAHRKLSCLFENGMTSEEHNRLRMKIYMPKAEQGDPNAQYWVGFLFSAVDRNAEKAKYWLTKAAERGNVEAMKSLAFGYSKFLNEEFDSNYGPIGLGFNKQEQVRWLSRAIEAGDAESMCNLADEYRLGELVEEDIEKAIDLYVGAAKQNYGKAYLGLADIYSDIRTAYYSKKKQLEVLLKAMQCRDKDVYERASFSLGNLFGAPYMYDGQEDEISDRKKAAYCFCLTYVLGNDWGRKNLEELKYTVSKEEFEQWKYDALNLVYNREVLEG